MAVIEITRPFAGGRLLGGRLASIFAAFAAWNDKRATRKALEKLTDRELEDIGLVRGDIHFIGK